jgi:hypothetical protein
MSDVPFLPVNYNGRALRLRAIQITEGPRPALPRWIVDVEGTQGTAQSLETAILLAARGADLV